MNKVKKCYGELTSKYIGPFPYYKVYNDYQIKALWLNHSEYLTTNPGNNPIDATEEEVKLYYKYLKLSQL